MRALLENLQKDARLQLVSAIPRNDCLYVTLSKVPTEMWGQIIPPPSFLGLTPLGFGRFVSKTWLVNNDLLLQQTPPDLQTFRCLSVLYDLICDMVFNF